MLVVQTTVGTSAVQIIANTSKMGIPYVPITDLDKVDSSWPFVTHIGTSDFFDTVDTLAMRIEEIAKSHPHAVVITLSLNINNPTELANILADRQIKTLVVFPPYLGTYERFVHTYNTDRALIDALKDTPPSPEEVFHTCAANMPSVDDAKSGTLFVCSDGRDDATRDVLGFVLSYPKIFEIIESLRIPVDLESNTDKPGNCAILPIAELFSIGWRVARAELPSKYATFPKIDLVGASADARDDWKQPDMKEETYESYCARVQKFNDSLNFLGDWDKASSKVWPKGQLFVIPAFPASGSMVGPWCMEVTRDVSFEELNKLVQKLNEEPCAPVEQRNEQYQSIRIAMAARDAGILVQRTIGTIAVGRGLIPPTDVVADTQEPSDTAPDESKG